MVRVRGEDEQPPRRKRKRHGTEGEQDDDAQEEQMVEDAVALSAPVQQITQLQGGLSQASIQAPDPAFAVIANEDGSQNLVTPAQGLLMPYNHSETPMTQVLGEASQTDASNGSSFHVLSITNMPAVARAALAAQAERDEEELSEEESGWVVRVGNDPPPAWSKNQSKADSSHGSPAKQVRVE